MKAYVYSKKNAPDSLRLRDVEKPVPGSGQVLIRIHSVSMNAADYRSMNMGIGSKTGIYGADVAGHVEAIGQDTNKFQVGDAVFGDLSGCGFGGFAEYVAAPESVLAKKPALVSYENAAALPMAAITALQGLRDSGKIKAGHRVLVVGASGGVGLFALQLAKYFKAEVTAVCSSKNSETAKMLGADSTFDYSCGKLETLKKEFDVILAVNGNYPLLTYKKLLAPNGICVMIGGTISQIARFVVLGPLLSLGKKKFRILSSKPNALDLKFVVDLVADGRIRPAIDQRFGFPDIEAAYEYASCGHAGGKVVINTIP